MLILMKYLYGCSNIDLSECNKNAIFSLFSFLDKVPPPCHGYTQEWLIDRRSATMLCRSILSHVYSGSRRSGKVSVRAGKPLIAQHTSGAIKSFGINVTSLYQNACSYGTSTLKRKESSSSKEVDNNQNQNEPPNNDTNNNGAGSSRSSSDSKDMQKIDVEDYDDYVEPPQTYGQRVYSFIILSFQLGLASLAAYCLYVVYQELSPSRLAPQTLFNECYDSIKNKDEVTTIVGSNSRAFGRDTNNEGRRRTIDSRQYKGVDGSNRSRIRFTIQGSKGKLYVWCEVSDKMNSNEYVYIVCQDPRTARVVTIVDNRDRVDIASSNGPATTPWLALPGIGKQ